MDFWNWLNKTKETTTLEKSVMDSVDKQPKNESLAEHLKHCKAKQNKCPFVKNLINEDDIDNSPDSSDFEDVAEKNEEVEKLGDLFYTDGVSPKLIIAADKAYRNIVSGNSPAVRIPSEVLGNEGTKKLPKWMLLGYIVACAFQDDNTECEHVLEEFARKSGAWKDSMDDYFSTHYARKDFIGSGMEASVFHGGDGNVVKNSSLELGTSSALQKIERLMLGNMYLPQTAYTPFLLGRSNDGKLAFALKQREIQLAKKKLTKKQIAKWLNERGWVEKDSFLRNFVSKNEKFACLDMHKGNLVKDRDGNIICIDPCIVPNSYSVGMHGHYDYDNPPSRFVLT